jgi:hypothetical protein
LVESEVTVFHRLSQPSIPTKYLFYEMEDQRKSLEYKTYQDLIRTELAKHQYTETPSLSDADVIVAFNYGIDSGREKLESIPLIGQTGVSSCYTSGTATLSGISARYSGTTTCTPRYGIIGSLTESRTEYTRGLWLYVVDARELKSNDKIQVLYEGSARSAGSSSQLARVMPAMVGALFKQFPGKSGSTRRVTIPLQ